MDSPALIAVVSVLATLAAVSALGGTALLAGAYMLQRERLWFALRDRDAYKLRFEALESEVKTMRDLRNNKLYDRALGDLGFAARQSIVHLRALEAEVASELSVAIKLLETAPKQ